MVLLQWFTGYQIDSDDPVHNLITLDGNLLTSFLSGHPFLLIDFALSAILTDF